MYIPEEGVPDFSSVGRAFDCSCLSVYRMVAGSIPANRRMFLPL